MNLCCYVCVLHGPTEDQLMNDRDWPPKAITTVAGTAVCAEHISHLANHQVELEMRRLADDLTVLRAILVAMVDLLPPPPKTPESIAA